MLSGIKNYFELKNIEKQTIMQRKVLEGLQQQKELQMLAYIKKYMEQKAKVKSDNRVDILI